MRLWLSLAFISCLLSVAVPAEEESFDPKQPEFFTSEVEPILRQYCFRCHGTTMQGGGLRLDNHHDAKAGGDSGRALLALPNESELYRRLTTADADIRMPLSSPPLPDEEIETIRFWLENGAPWPARK